MSVYFFSNEETSFLKEILENRKKDVEEDLEYFAKSDSNFYYKPVLSCIKKLSCGGIDYFNKREIEIVKSCMADIDESQLNNSNTGESKRIMNIILSIDKKLSH